MGTKPYRIHAWLEERGTGTVDDGAETKREAFQKARALREQGFLVKITGPDGKPVTKEDD